MTLAKSVKQMHANLTEKLQRVNEALERPGPWKFEMRKRRTVMDGVVVTYARSFETETGAFGEVDRARGPFEVSASRNQVHVHRAILGNEDDLLCFEVALEAAYFLHREMRKGHR